MKRRVNLKEVLAEAVGKDVEVTESRDSAVVFPTVQTSGRKVRVVLPPAEAIETKKAYKQLTATLLAVYEFAARERTPEARRRRFSELILNLFRKW